MDEQPHRVAVLGAGNFARDAHLPAIAATPTLQLVAVYSRSSASVESLLKAAKKYASTSHDIATYSDSAAWEGLDALLSRSDIPTVVLALPIALQPSMIRRAFKAGKNIISEKPIAPSLAEAKHLIELYEKEYKPKGQTWIVAEQFPYEQSYDKAREIIQHGKIGEVRAFSAEVFVQPGPLSAATEWRKTPEYQGGFLLDGGVHFAAGLRHMLPYPITATYAHSSQIQPSLPPCDTLTGLLTADSPSSSPTPITGSFTFSFGVESSSTRLYTFRGSKGTLTVNFEDPKMHVLTLTTLPHSPDEDKPHQLVIEFPARGVEEEFDAFGEALLAGPKSAEWEWVQRRSGPRAALRDLGLIEGALTSAKERREVDLRELAGEGWFDV
ncbi:hypothetical protein JCM21900_005619 [Sporobolomyces salmonicolor]